MSAKFYNAKSPLIRAVLLGGQTDSDVGKAVIMTEESLQADHEVYAARERACEMAAAAWKSSNYPATIAALRLFWTL